MTHPSVKAWIEEIQETRHWYPGMPKTRDEIIAEYIAKLEKQVADLQKRNSDLNWEINPDRSGGQFTQQEIDEARRGGHGW